MTIHLTHEQLCDLILADSSLSLDGESCNASWGKSDVVQAHLLACPVCSAELRSLRDSLSHFRNASISYARQEFAQSYARQSSITPPHSYLSQPLYWTAAGSHIYCRSVPAQHAQTTPGFLDDRNDHFLVSADERVRRGAPRRHRSEALGRCSLPDGTTRRPYRRNDRDDIQLRSKDQLICD